MTNPKVPRCRLDYASCLLVIGRLDGGTLGIRGHIGYIFTACLIGLSGCERQPSQSLITTKSPVTASETQRHLRIVSLAPALTQMIDDMGCRHSLVGVGENDFAAPREVRIVGEFMSINTEALIKVRPTHVLAMYGRGGPPNHLVRLSMSYQFKLHIYNYPRRVDQVLQMLYRTEDFAPSGSIQATRSLAKVLGAPELGRRAWLRMRDRLDRIRALTSDRDKPSVLMVIGTSPIMACGPDTVLHDLLETCAGGRNAARDSALSAPTFDREKLLKLQPQVILMFLPKEPPLQDLKGDPRLASLHDLPIPAVQHGRIMLISDPMAVLPSSSLPRIAAEIVRALHPDLTSRVDAIMRQDPT